MFKKKILAHDYIDLDVYQLVKLKFQSPPIFFSP